MTGERRLPRDELDRYETTPRWVDAHSVTCAICGDLADERETIDLYDDRSEPMGVRVEKLLAIEEYGHGEVHQSCFEEMPLDQWPVSVALVGEAIHELEQRRQNVDDEQYAEMIEQTIEGLIDELTIQDPRPD